MFTFESDHEQLVAHWRNHPNVGIAPLRHELAVSEYLRKKHDYAMEAESRRMTGAFETFRRLAAKIVSCRGWPPVRRSARLL